MNLVTFDGQQDWSKDITEESNAVLAWAAQRFPFFTWRLVWRLKGGGWDGKYITP